VTEPVGVVLAAGLATRMGRPKQLLPFGDGTVLGSVIEAALHSELARTVVVLGAYEDEVRRTVDLTRVDVVVNPDPARGNLSSLQTAAAVCGASPLLLLMGDMPGVEAGVIDSHLVAESSGGAWLRATRYSDGTGHPLLLSAELVASLGALTGPKPLWSLLHDERASFFDVAGEMPVDVDTPEDYGEALARDAAE